MATPDDTHDGPPADATVELERLRGENDALRSRLDTRARWRRWLTIVLVVLTTISVVGTTIAVWAHATVFDTDTFMETVQPALDDPALYEAFSERATDEIITALAVEVRVAETLDGIDEYLSDALLDAVDISDRGQAILDRFDRPSLAVLAGPIADQVNTRIEAIVDSFFTSEEFRARFPDLVRQSHVAVVALVRNDLAELPNVYIEDGDVRLNLTPIIAEALRRVATEIRDFLPDVALPDVISNQVDEGREQIAAALRAELPEDFGQVTLFSEQRLSDVQDAAGRLDRLVWALVALTMILAISTIAFSATRRRTTIQLSLAVAGGLVIGLVALRRIEALILEQITSANGLDAARTVLGEVVGSLRTVTLSIVIGGIAVALIAYITGRPAWLTNLAGRWRHATEGSPQGSDVDRWVSGHHDLLVVAGVAVAVVTLFMWGVGLASIIVIAGGLALYLWAIASARRRVPAAPETQDHMQDQ